MKDKKLEEAFGAILNGNPSKFNSLITSKLKVKLAEKFNSLESSVVSERFDYLDEMSHGEARFKSMHGIEKHDHPVAPESTFTSDKVKAKKLADSEEANEDPDEMSTNELMKTANIRGQVT